jgi:hypothetical protein
MRSSTTVFALTQVLTTKLVEASRWYGWLCLKEEFRKLRSDVVDTCEGGLRGAALEAVEYVDMRELTKLMVAELALAAAVVESQ